MGDNDQAPSVETPIVDRSERGGNVGLVVALAVALVTAAAVFALLDRDQAQPYVLGLLGLLAVVGVFSLFAGAVGLVRLGAASDGQMSLSKRFLDTMTDGVCVTDADGRIVYANAAYGRLIRAETATDVRTVERVFSGDPDAADVIFRLAQASREGRRAHEEVRVAHPLGRNDGPARWYRIRVRPLSGLPMTLNVWQVADITRDRDEQEDSFQALQRAVDFLDHAPAGFLSITALGRIAYMNATLADWLGVDLAEFEVGAMSVKDIIVGDGASLLDGIRGASGEVKTGMVDLDFI